MTWPPYYDGTLHVDIAPGAARDLAGNPNWAAPRLSIDYALAFTPAITAAQPSPTRLQTVPFNMIFNKPINSSTLDASDIVVTSGEVRNLRLELRHDGDFGGGAGGPFDGPHGVAVDASSGTIYVADSGNDRVAVFDSDRRHTGDLPGRFRTPLGRGREQPLRGPYT